MSQIETKSNILIVDDNPANLSVLSTILAERGYVVRPAPNGQMALMALQKFRPDLILLDIMMPKIDGYEVCRRLKEDEQTRDIPVIFMSALSEVLDKVKAFDVGGVDYITKPFQAEEVLARVKTHLALRELQKELERKVAERTAELQHSEKKYRAIFEDSKDVIYITSVAGQIEDVSPACFDLLGYTRAELLARNVIEVYAQPLDHQRFRQEIDPRGSVKDFAVKLRHKDGTERDCLITATLRQNDNAAPIYQGIIRDVTAQKQAEQERLKLVAMQQELNLAKQIQESLLPPPQPNWSDIEVICFSAPAREVGGIYTPIAILDWGFQILD